MINLAFVMLAASTYLLNPPTSVSWGYAELQPKAGVEQQAETCGVSHVAVFSARARQIATDSFTDEQRHAIDDLVGRLEEEWVDASGAERAGLFLELRDIASAKNSRSIQQTWVKLDSVLVHFLMVVDGPSGNILVKLEDEVTGEYAAVVFERAGEIDQHALFQSLFDLGLEGDELKAVYQEAMRVDGGTNPDVNQEAVKIFQQFKEEAEQSTTRVEVNGVVKVLDHEMPVRRGQAQEALAELWPNLPEGEGRSRLEMAISVIRKVVEFEAEQKEKGFAGAIVGLHSGLDAAPEDPCLTDGAAIVGFRKGGSTTGFEAPPEDITDDFFGEQGLPLPDPDWSFKRLKKEIL